MDVQTGLQTLDLFIKQLSVVQCVGYIAFLVTIIAIKRSLLTPLRSIPGPWYCTISEMPAIIMAIKGVKSPWTQSLFKKYGNVVRVGPNTVAFNTIAATKVIYSNSPWEKADFYNSFEIGGRMHLLGVRVPAEASKRRKAIMPSFSTANLRETTPVIHFYITKFTAQIEAAQEIESSVDMFRWYRLLAFDIIADLAFDHKFKMLELGAKAEIVDLIHGTITHAVAASIIPGLDLALSLSFSKKAKAWMNSSLVVGKMGSALLAKHLEKPLAERESAILSMFNKHYKESGRGEAETYAMVASEASALLIAGSDTTSMTLVYLTYLLALHPQFQTKLQVELDSHFSDRDYIAVVSELDRLPYLNAVIKEILRLNPAVPGDLPRRVPKGGVVLENYVLPEMTTAFCQSYSINRIQEVFGADAESFNPSRYMDDNETAEMKSGMFSFSAGSRNCAGMNLAYAELKIITAYVFRRYNVTLAPETTPASMVPSESFFTAPVSMQTRLILNFRP